MPKPAKLKLPKHALKAIKDHADRRRWIVWMPNKFLAGTHNASDDLMSVWSAYKATLYKRKKYAEAIAKVCNFKGTRVLEVRINKKDEIVKSTLPKELNRPKRRPRGSARTK